MSDLLIIVPTRSRPEAVGRVVAAWEATNAFGEGAELLFVYDGDDPAAPRYHDAFDDIGLSEVHRCRFRRMPAWKPLVPKLNTVAAEYARYGEHFAIGFAGDDHLPRTRGWVAAYLGRLRLMRTGVVSCPDGYRPDELPTQWAMTSDIVRSLGEMVPAPVEHLYCDDAVRDLAVAAECYSYLSDHLIEHMHPAAGKAPADEQYERVNSRRQFRGDRTAYRHWRDNGGLAAATAQLRGLIERGGRRDPDCCF